ncbi:hypothetical protein NDU88_003598 [Pleurodeles waltl]|uniref:Uncharacterized protein n=1 Tax=Pleurodeles waltl TaxID=8319 RepID=A0AAV7RDC7_PLEWA|nr:hypothetical protein NDU88_003598 [Pleurodeles waltl]
MEHSDQQLLNRFGRRDGVQQSREYASQQQRIEQFAKQNVPWSETGATGGTPDSGGVAQTATILQAINDLKVTMEGKMVELKVDLAVMRQDLCNTAHRDTESQDGDDYHLLFADGSKVTGHGSMAHAFANYYQSLYGADPTSPRLDLLQFIHDLPVPSLSAEDRASLETDISVKELRTALGQLNSGKAPKLNGFPPEYWCLVWQHAGRPMLEMFQEAVEKGKLSLDLRTTDIVVLPKPGTVGHCCEDFKLFPS